jgi:outer membrane protein assembly factor BamD (BamD/ComL family)
MRRRSGIALALALCVLACQTAQPRLSDPASLPRAEWNTWLVQASQEATSGNFAGADRLLMDYSTRYPAMPEAAEAMYWRALYKMDPSNSVAAPKDAAVLLDGYLASGTTTHRAEAQTLRRVATALDVAKGVAGSNPSKPDVVKVDDKARDEELAHVREELSRANAELERIKRRLAQPKP